MSEQQRRRQTPKSIVVNGVTYLLNNTPPVQSIKIIIFCCIFINILMWNQQQNVPSRIRTQAPSCLNQAPWSLYTIETLL